MRSAFLDLSCIWALVWMLWGIYCTQDTVNSPNSSLNTFVCVSIEIFPIQHVNNVDCWQLWYSGWHYSMISTCWRRVTVLMCCPVFLHYKMLFRCKSKSRTTVHTRSWKNETVSFVLICAFSHLDLSVCMQTLFNLCCLFQHHSPHPLFQKSFSARAVSRSHQRAEHILKNLQQEEEKRRLGREASIITAIPVAQEACYEPTCSPPPEQEEEGGTTRHTSTYCSPT